MKKREIHINEALKSLSLQTLSALQFPFDENNTALYNSGTREMLDALRSANLTQRIDQLEAFMVNNFEPIICELIHKFTKGLYTRKIIMPAGSCVISKIHKTEHPYEVLAGHCTVFIGNENGVKLWGGDSGITKPGTRRRILVHEETIWLTMHVTNKTTVEEVEEEIIEKHINPFMVTAQNNLICHG